MKLQAALATAVPADAAVAAGVAVLEVRARTRAAHQWLPPLQPSPTPLMTVCDFGAQLDKPARRCNIARHDPWYFRACEVSGATRFDPARPQLHAKLLQLFALAGIDTLRAKFGLQQPFERIVLTSAAAETPDETLDAGEVLGASGRGAVQRLRLQFVAGRAAALLVRNGYKLQPLMEQARA